MQSITARSRRLLGACAALAMIVSPLPAPPALAAPAGAAALPPLAALAVTPRTVVSFTFDDGDADQMMAAAVLHKYGLHGTFYIITGAVGAPKYVTLADLHTLAAEGDEIGGHTVSHLELPHVTPAEARRQVCQGRDTLITWGFHPISFAYPGGVYSPATEAIVRECGFTSGRTVVGLRSPGCPACVAAEAIPPADPYAIRVPGQVDGSWTVATLEGLVTGLERGGGWLPLVFHHVCGTGHCPSGTIRLSVVAAFAKWLAARRAIGTVVETVGQVVGGPVRPMVTAPAAAAHGVTNPWLQVLGNPGGVNPTNEAPTRSAPFPLCWMKGDYGQNGVTWQRVRGGHGSPWAVRLTMLSHRSGAATLIQQFDTGQCSIPAAAGQSYDLSTWYKATARTQFSVYYQLPAGRWLYWTSSPFYRAAAQWAHAAWTTPPLPSGGRGLSFGLSLASRGSLLTDEYSIRATRPSVTRGILDVIVLVLLAGGVATAVARAWRRRRRAGGPTQSGAAANG